MTTVPTHLSRLPLPPALPSLPVLGNMHQFAKDRHGLIEQGYHKLGPIFSFKIGSKPVAVVIGPEYHQWFFLETDKQLSIEKPYRNLAAVLGKVGFLAPHEVYQEQRPILYAPFRPEKMASYVQIMQRVIQEWLDTFGPSGEIELTEAIGLLVQNVAGATLMGEDFQRRLGREFWDLYAVVGKTLNNVTPPNWPLPKNIRRDRAKQRMQEMLAPIIRERRAHPELYDDFLQDFINTPTRSGAVSDDETVIGMIRALMFAGHETTAGQAAWTIIELLRTPEYLQLVEQEIATHLPKGTLAEGKALRGLEHIFWAVREVERLHPSTDMLLRMTDQEVEIGNYRIPAGWLVMVAPGIAQRTPDLFSQPEQFDPLRFSPARAEDKQHGYSLITFGGGKHKCAGMNFANNEMMLITAMLFQQFELELVTKNTVVDYSRGAARPAPTIVRYRRRTQ